MMNRQSKYTCTTTDAIDDLQQGHVNGGYAHYKQHQRKAPVHDTVHDTVHEFKTVDGGIGTRRFSSKAKLTSWEVPDKKKIPQNRTRRKTSYYIALLVYISVFVSITAGVLYYTVSSIMNSETAKATEGHKDLVTTPTRDIVTLNQDMIVFHGELRLELIEGQAVTFSTELNEAGTDEFKSLAKQIEESLDDVYVHSNLSALYNSSKVTGFRNGSIISEFDIIFNLGQLTDDVDDFSETSSISTVDVFNILTRTVAESAFINDSSIFSGVDPDSITIVKAISTNDVRSTQSLTKVLRSTQTFVPQTTQISWSPDEDYECHDINVNACDSLPYNRTILPVNAVEAMNTNVGLLLNIVRGCHPDIDVYLCAMAIPECPSPGSYRPRSLCPAFCHEILEDCEDVMTQIGVPINCSVSSQGDHVTDETNTCIQPSNSTKALDSRRCKDDEFVCGNGRCILMADVCNHKNDCGDSSDETNCYYPTCHRIELDVCNVLPYNTTILPASVVKDLNQMFTFVFQLAGNCHKHLKFVICAMTLPECPDAGSLVSRPVCRPLCEEVLEECGYILDQLHIPINCSMTQVVPDYHGCIEPDDTIHD
ncbi:uncharacterized protein LOC102807079 [Saccoglossus kowalevskii]|uniref:Uncharacterized protein LOC102807079 n=1 Tax=Saccoglossus kowalevskii TaxID=10224 RepID=A0ABM0MR65_SACKO|nr:PREDICTED: uncharacterized protein LOC102807079 [Saccoglossus kowalevskii]